MGLTSYDSLRSAVQGIFGSRAEIDGRSYVGGGDINIASCLTLSSGERVFVKSNFISKKAFFDAAPLQPGYDDRRDMYNLYHMLNHLNLFGSGYLGSVKSIVRRYR